MDSIRTRINLRGTWIDKVDILDVGQRVTEFVRSGRPHQVVPANLDFLRLCDEDRTFRSLLNSASLVVPDGMPLVWASRLTGEPAPRRIAGMDLILECARTAAEQGYGLFLLGAGPGIADRAASLLCEQFPGLRVVGAYAPPPLPLSPWDEQRTIDTIRAARPDILLVAFGAPLQERWIQQNMLALGVPVCIGVGGAFDMLAGKVSRAPAVVQRAGFEWLYRLVLEPGRLWKRYMLHDLPFFFRLMTACGLGAPNGMTATEVPQLAVEAPLPGIRTIEASNPGEVAP